MELKPKTKETRGKYILDEKGNAVEETDLFKWSAWFETSDVSRILKQEKVGRVMVSTVFLALDYDFFFHPKKKPILWETMIFGGKRDKEQYRYRSKISALRNHKKIVEEIKNDRKRVLPNPTKSRIQRRKKMCG